MMKTTDLRIGNYLQDSISKETLEVLGISKDEIRTRVRNRDKFPLPTGWQAEAIPISKEWLIDLGFKQDEQFPNFFYHEAAAKAIEYDEEGKFFRFRICQMQGHPAFAISMNYVHEVQNMVFALEKLELKLPDLPETYPF